MKEAASFSAEEKRVKRESFGAEGRRRASRGVGAERKRASRRTGVEEERRRGLYLRSRGERVWWRRLREVKAKQASTREGEAS